MSFIAGDSSGTGDWETDWRFPDNRESAMPRFFFDLSDGSREMDAEGVELAGLDEARALAVKFTGELLRDNSLMIWEGEDLRVEVYDARRRPLFVVSVSAGNVFPDP